MKNLRINWKAFPFFWIMGIIAATFTVSLDTADIDMGQCFQYTECLKSLCVDMPLLALVFVYPMNYCYNRVFTDYEDATLGTRILFGFSIGFFMSMAMCIFICVGGLLLIIPLSFVAVPAAIIWEIMGFVERRKVA